MDNFPKFLVVLYFLQSWPTLYSIHPVYNSHLAIVVQSLRIKTISSLVNSLWLIGQFNGADYK